MEFTDEMKDEVLTKYLGKASHEKVLISKGVALLDISPEMGE